MRFFTKKFEGFSLVELMATVAIIGVLTSSALTSYNSFVIRSRQAEAKMMLKTIFALEEAYHTDSGTYLILQTSIDGPHGFYGRDGRHPDKHSCELVNGGPKLGFKLRACGSPKGPRYGYGVFAATTTYFIAFAASSYDTSTENVLAPTCTGVGSAIDVWTLNNQNVLQDSDNWNFTSETNGVPTGTTPTAFERICM